MLKQAHFFPLSVRLASRVWQSLVACVLLMLGFSLAISAQSANAVAVTSAASFDTQVAPASLAAAFGNQFTNQTLASTDVDPNTPGVQLPTELGGVSVMIGGRRAGLIFVSPAQINFYVPPDVATGTVAVTVNGPNGTRTGEATVAANAPGIFTATNSGQGLASGLALRVRGGTGVYEPLVETSGGALVARPINLGPESEQVYLVLFGTGWRNAGNRVRLLAGGLLLEPQFAGAQPDILGLDQLNFLLPRALLGLGRVQLSLVADGAVSNTVEVEIGGLSGSSSPVVAAVSPDVTEATQTLTINGNGFAPTPAGNRVRIGSTDAEVLSATPTQLTVRVPYGSESGKVLVRTINGDGLSANQVKVRTSLSGVVENTNRQPLGGVTIRALTGLRLLSTTSRTNGTFVLSEFMNPDSGVARLVIDGGTAPSTPRFGTLTVMQEYLGGRDTQFLNPLSLQPVSGASAQVGGGGFQRMSEEPILLRQPVMVQQQPGGPTVQDGEVLLELPADTQVRFPDGGTSGAVALTVVEAARLPVTFPGPLWSSAVAQVTPFGTTFSKGGRMRFPNPEKYPANSRVLICQLDQGQTSPNIGSWTAPGNATVSSDGQSIITDPGTITQGSYYFLVDFRKTTTVTGRVVDSDGRPVRRASVRVRGKQALTDGTGGFLLRSVAVGDGEAIFAEATFPRPSGRVDRANSALTRVVPGGLTNVGVLTLPSESLNQLPVIAIASTLTVQAGKLTDFEFQAFDFEDMRVPRLTVSGAPFASILPTNNQNTALLRLAPTSAQIGEYELTITAVDGQGSAVQHFVLVRVVR